MAAIPKVDLGALETIAKIIGDTSNGLTGSQIAKYLGECSIEDRAPNLTKWKRLFEALANKQEEDRCANNVFAFIQHVMKPARHIDRHDWFNEVRYKLNNVLSFEGLLLGEDGKVTKTQKSNTISEAAAKASRLKEKLIARNVHPDVLSFCREELLVDNYFHSVFEATKSVAEKIRNRTGLLSDGATLVDEAFSFNSKIPYLALNSLQSESEQSEQKGFMNLLKGVFGTFRNTTAHAPKIIWKIEEIDALDILSMISLIHRRLDGAVESRQMYQGTQLV